MISRTEAGRVLQKPLASPRRIPARSSAFGPPYGRPARRSRNSTIRDMQAVLEARQRGGAAQVAAIRTLGENRTLPLRELFEGSPEDPTAPGRLLTRLKALGVNPAGNDVLYQDFRYDGSYRRWTDFFDFSQPGAGWNAGLSPEGREKHELLRQKVVSEISGVLFSRLYFGFESAGLGYVRLDLSEDALATISAECGADPRRFSSICDATLRVMGALYRYPQEPEDYPLFGWPDWEAARAKLRNFVRECAAVNNLGEQATLRAVWRAICQDGGHGNLILAARRLNVRIAVAGDPVWICPNCQREHLHSAGVCTNCRTSLPLDPTATCGDLYARNYYREEAVEFRQPLRLHCRRAHRPDGRPSPAPTALPGRHRLVRRGRSPRPPGGRD